jgi:hypothetical protein
MRLDRDFADAELRAYLLVQVADDEPMTCVRGG